MKKKLILLSIIIFPSLLYFMFELTQANFKKMPFFGPKTVNEKGDTVYWSVFNTCFLKNLEILTDTSYAPNDDKRISGDSVEIVIKRWKADSIQIDTTNYPVYAILFLQDKQKSEGFKLQGLVDYIKYKSKDLKDVPLFIVSSFPSALNGYKGGVVLRGAYDSLGLNFPGFIPLVLTDTDQDKFMASTYFKQKPVHVFDYFMVLVDKKRHIRGYYDPSFNAEVKRMIDEYKHLKIRDEYAETLKQNDIKQNESK